MSGRTPFHWRPTIEQVRVRNDAAAAFGATPWALVGGNGKPRLTIARFGVAWVLHRRFPHLSWRQLSRLLGRDDHSVSFYRCARADELRTTDMTFHFLTEALAAGRDVPVCPPAPIRAVKAKNDMQEDDPDSRLRAAGTNRLLEALRREFPERVAA